MSKNVWLGSIFIKNEGGFEIVMRALNHYNRRLHRISDSPEIAGAGAMFGSILQSESMKIMPKLKPVADRLRAGLVDASTLQTLEADIDIIEKALICYGSDIKKADETAHQYYSRLVDGNTYTKKDLPMIEEVIRRIKQYD